VVVAIERHRFPVEGFLEHLTFVVLANKAVLHVGPIRLEEVGVHVDRERIEDTDYSRFFGPDAPSGLADWLNGDSKEGKTTSSLILCGVIVSEIRVAGVLDVADLILKKLGGLRVPAVSWLKMDLRAFLSLSVNNSSNNRVRSVEDKGWRSI
jgi:hypothetical protein